MDDSVWRMYRHRRKNSEKKVTKKKEKKVACQTQNFYISLAFLLITLAFLIAVRIY